MEGRPGAFFEPLALAYALAVLAATVVALTVTPALRAAPRRAAAGREPAVLSPAAGLLRRARSARFMRDARGGAGRGRRRPAGRRRSRRCRSWASSPRAGVPGPRRARPARRRSPARRNPRMTEIAGGRQPRAAGRCPASRTSAPTSAARSPATGSSTSTRASVWVEHRRPAPTTTRRVRRSTTRWPRVGRRRARRRDVLRAQKLRDVGALTTATNDATARARRTDRRRAAARRARLRPGPRDAASARPSGCGELMAGVDGVVDAAVERPDDAADRRASRSTSTGRRRFGIKPGDVRRAEATLLQGIQVGSVFEEQKVFDVIVQGVPAHAREPSRTCATCSSTGPAAATCASGEVADVRVATHADRIEREAVSRYARHRGRRQRAQRSAPSPATSSDASRTCRFRSSTTPRCSTATHGREIGAGRVLGVRARRRCSRRSCCCRRRSAAGAWPRSSSSLLPVALAGGVLAALVAGGDALARRAGRACWRCSGSPRANGARCSSGTCRTSSERRRAVRARISCAAAPASASRRSSTTAVRSALLMLPFVVAGLARRAWRSSTRWPSSLLGGLVTSTFADAVRAARPVPALDGAARPARARGGRGRRPRRGAELGASGGRAAAGVQPARRSGARDEPVAAAGRSRCAAACSLSACTRGRVRRRGGYEPAQLDAVEGGGGSSWSRFTRGGRATGSALADGGRARRAGAGRPLRGADLRGRRQHVRLHGPEPLTYVRARHRGRPRRRRPRCCWRGARRRAPRS